MSLLTDDSAVMIKTKELCATIVGDGHYKALMSKVETFENDSAARLAYQNLHQLGEELHQKSHSGIELSDSEINNFESAKESLLSNPVARDFLEAQRELETVQKAIGKYVGMTLEYGRVPSASDIANASGGGCCGGGGGGGCGCH